MQQNELQIYPIWYIIALSDDEYNRSGIMMSTIGSYVKVERKKLGMTQEEFAARSGLGLRFVRDLEQGKETVRLDKVNQALRMFGMEAIPGREASDHE